MLRFFNEYRESLSAQSILVLTKFKKLITKEKLLPMYNKKMVDIIRSIFESPNHVIGNHDKSFSCSSLSLFNPFDVEL